MFQSYGKWALLPMRLIMGFGFMVHGWAKLSRGPEGFAGLLMFIGVPLPELTAWGVTLLELFGGLALVVGAFVPLVSIPLIVAMLVAMFTIHLQYGFSSIRTVGMTAAGPEFGAPGFEVNLLYIGGLLALFILGAGPLSVDNALASRKADTEMTEPEPAA